jgi:biopolymer transport protein ExbD
MKRFESDDDSGYAMNLTPMIDIMFLLIIFFLATTSIIQLEQDLSIDLPKQGQRLKTKTPPAAPIVVNVRHVPGSSGKASYHVKNQPMTLSALTANLSRAKIRNPDQSVVIRGDRNVRWDHVAQVLARCGQVGITKVAATIEIRQPR